MRTSHLTMSKMVNDVNHENLICNRSALSCRIDSAMEFIVVYHHTGRVSFEGKIPKLLSVMWRALLNHDGLKMEGILRRSADKTLVIASINFLPFGSDAR